MALLWARATAVRDGEAVVPSLDRARPLIRRVLDSSARSLLLVAVTDDGRTVGFVAAEPASETGAEVSDVAEVRYVGVDPEAWGSRVGARMLQALPRWLVARGFAYAQLMVYVDNRRAVGLYEGQGWRPHGAATVHPRSGKPEQRYRIALVGRGTAGRP